MNRKPKGGIKEIMMLSEFLKEGFLNEFSKETNVIDLKTVYVVIFKLNMIGLIETDDTRLLLELMYKINLCQGSPLIHKFLEERFIPLFFRCLKSKIKFTTFDELLDVTKDIAVEAWLINHYSKLVVLFPDFYVYNNKLYYCNRTERLQSNLNSISCDHLDNIDAKDDDLDDNTPIKLLDDVCEILGFQDNYLYVAKKNLWDAFVRYDIQTKQCKTIYASYIGNVSTKPIILDKNNSVGIIYKDNINWIGKLDPEKQLSIFENKIIEEGKYPFFYKPLYWDENGHKHEFDEEFNRYYLLNKLVSSLDDDGYSNILVWNPLTRQNYEAFLQASVPPILSVNTIQDYFRRISKKKSISLYSKKYFLIIKTLEFLEKEKYISRNEDLTDKLYMLLHANARLEKDKSFGFSQSLYNCLNKIARESGQEKKPSFNHLLEKLKKEYVWTDEYVSLKRKQELNKKPCIGYFTIDGERLYPTCVLTDDAVCIGDYRMLLPKEPDQPDIGLIMYDMSHNKYIIKYHQALETTILNKIIRTFKLKHYPLEIQS